ncbi:histone deacetylase family protein [Neisseria shayeganii]|uniref:Histone deacetylase n=1 Tax=Neisseria shayeganii 871 TaxID=1032488 RepID=G4CEK6_9NEIS|nr:histone deacetylase family protein [Neisseria shayeganii]EGY53734.1 histone deacetylase [Neisseria shayeganii 871]
MFEWLSHFSSSMGMTAYITHPACFGHNMGEGHPEAPARLSAIRDRLMSAQLFDFLQEVEAPLVSDIQLARVHPTRYLNYLESVQPDTGTYRVDTDTAMNSGTLKAARYAAGAVVKAVDMVMNEEVPNAFCAVRPPGHHAETEKAMGFCFFNNVAVGAMHAIAEYRLERVAIIDFDVHHGNGTEEIFKDEDRVMLLSCFQHPFFPYCGDKPIGSNPNIINTPMKSGTRGAEFRDMVSEVWLPKLHAFEPQLVFICAGFDAHLEDEMGNFGLVEADYKWVTQQIMLIAQLYCNGKIVSSLEGGYTLSPLARSVAEHVKVLAGV